MPGSRSTSNFRDVVPVVWKFFGRELLSILLWSSLGALVAGLIRLLSSDRNFDAFLLTTYLPSKNHFDEPSRYLPFIAAALGALILVVVVQIPRLVSRGFNSWRLGVTSGMSTVSFLATFWVLSIQHYSVRTRIVTYAVVILTLLAAAVFLHLGAIKRSVRTPKEEDIRVPLESKNLIGRDISESDDPIQTWAEDALGRTTIVDSLTIKLLISKAPVIGLFGEFGSGKTSILNLLSEHLRDKAITVSFSTWKWRARSFVPLEELV